MITSDPNSPTAVPSATELGMRVEIDALRTKVESMHGVIAQLTSSVRRLATNYTSLSQKGRDQLVETVRVIGCDSRTKAACLTESQSWDESSIRVPFDDQDYSYLDELFPEEEQFRSIEVDALLSTAVSPDLPQSAGQEQRNDDLNLPLASAALYAFIASQVNNPGSLLSQRGSSEFFSQDSSSYGLMR